MIFHEDEHLNIFWSYGGKAGLENNVTKALINTLASLNTADAIGVLQRLGIISDFAEKTTHIRYYLQKQPGKEKVEKFPSERRLLWGISPTGKAWEMNDIPIESLNFHNETEAIQLIYNQLTEMEKDDVAWKEAKKQFEEIRKIYENKGDSIPDGWILSYAGDEPLYCVAIENKWYNLDPYQLKNHWEKSLLVKNGKTKYSTYGNIYREMLMYKGENVPKHFLEYMSLLGQEPIIGFYKDDFIKLTDDFYKNNVNILCRKFFRYLDRLLGDFADKNSLKYDSKKKRLEIPNIDHLNLFFDFNAEKGIFSVSTEIGVDKSDINCRLYPMLRENSNIMKSIGIIYQDCSYVRHVRLNSGNLSLYFWIKEYTSMEDYFENIDMAKIVVSGCNKSECYDELQRLGVPVEVLGMQRLSKWKPPKWHWLEYLRIIRDIDIKEYCATNTEALDNVLTKVFYQHLKGIKLLAELLQ